MRIAKIAKIAKIAVTPTPPREVRVGDPGHLEPLLGLKSEVSTAKRPEPIFENTL